MPGCVSREVLVPYLHILHKDRSQQGEREVNEKQKLERQAIKLDEVARRLGVSRNSAYAAARRGQIPTIRIGRLLLVPIAALDRMLEGNAA